MNFQVLTKGGTRALRDIDLYTENDFFGSTLTFTSNQDTFNIEPNTAFFHDRVVAIEEFHNRGIYTWVSLEPVISVEQTLDIIERTHHCVDLYKVGKLNYQHSTIDWANFRQNVTALLDRLKCKYYIKEDLMKCK